jgi:hypothetical protein
MRTVGWIIAWFGLWVWGARAADLLQAQEEGRTLATDMCARFPAQDIVSQGVLAIRSRDGSRTQVPIKFSVIRGDQRWTSTYEALTTNQAPWERLEIVHTPGIPAVTNEYRLQKALPDGHWGAPGVIPNQETAIAFAGSDFWLADLGLEFFHWPEQRFLKKEMRKSRTCNVLESINPHLTPGNYARVISWLDIETGGLLLAEAYDQKGQLWKEFSVRGFSKVQGQWQLKEMEIRNAKTDSKTRLEFDLKLKDAP